MAGPSYALVTGASTGAWQVLCHAIAARQSNLVLVARSKDKLTSLANE